MTIQVFDKPMCCSTGICGPQVDQTLVRFAGDLDWLRRQGVTVERFNLSQQPQEFAALPDVRAALQFQGVAALPIIRLNGSIVCQGTYPNRELLASWAHVAAGSEAVLPVTTASCCQTGSGCC